MCASLALLGLGIARLEVHQGQRRYQEQRRCRQLGSLDLKRLLKALQLEPSCTVRNLSLHQAWLGDRYLS